MAKPRQKHHTHHSIFKLATFHQQKGSMYPCNFKLYFYPYFVDMKMYTYNTNTIYL